MRLMDKKNSNSQQTITDEGEEEENKVKACRTHSYCYKYSNPSSYPIGLPWASGKLKCLPGYCKYDENGCNIARKKSDIGAKVKKKKKAKFIKTLMDEDSATQKELVFLSQMASLAGDYDIDLKKRVGEIVQQLKNSSDISWSDSNSSEANNEK
ncbi:uncharacterized protein LOC106670054 isoform X2 [Cimex lectularius]|uniref:Uncharacterized protein n=1 Tax=Cimex lectularius TaxID=79782 RepID=A0A8I6S3L4_CIMLE|nr:uncharacterized protein LOC106670054 isoform X2 [Cimex lectularius]